MTRPSQSCGAQSGGPDIRAPLSEYLLDHQSDAPLPLDQFRRLGKFEESTARSWRPIKHDFQSFSSASQSATRPGEVRERQDLARLDVLEFSQANRVRLTAVQRASDGVRGWQVTALPCRLGQLLRAQLHFSLRCSLGPCNECIAKLFFAHFDIYRSPHHNFLI